AKMSHVRFISFNTLASIHWSALFVYLGWKLGEKWENINEVAGPYIKYFAITAVALAVFYFVVKKLMRRRG
ncbi:DedA family protein, partial [Bacillus pseudomycoides]|uniref:DedA family protein n=1 Tax=Bacillus pseudomycoides TaxID=64104 RepID=UPI0028494FCD|nr:DedA family protein [Bacillus pseudomycoides]